MRFMPGEVLYQVADLSSVWVVADVFEQDIGLVKLGAQAKVRINAYPDKLFEGKVSYVYPTLNAATRTVPAVSYTHLDVYKRQVFELIVPCQPIGMVPIAN